MGQELEGAEPGGAESSWQVAHEGEVAGATGGQARGSGPAEGLPFCGRGDSPFPASLCVTCDAGHASEVPGRGGEAAVVLEREE